MPRTLLDAPVLEKDVAEDLEDYKEQLENEISLLERKLARIKSHKNENILGLHTMRLNYFLPYPAEE